MDSLSSFLATLSDPFSSTEMTFWQSLVAFFAAYLGGVLASLTPCVYPMIPITLGVVGGIGPSKKSGTETLLGGISYLAGMTVVYSFLGVIAGISGRVFGSFTNNSGWFLTLGVVLSLSALIMLEVIPFDPLTWWETLKHNLRHRRGPQARPSPNTREELSLIGAFVLGASSGLIAAPCTTPVLTSILAYIAKTQSLVLGFFLMFAFSLGLGTLLLLMTLFAGMIRILPRSGQWMKSIKILSGIILLGFAEYLIYRAGSFGGP
jgi:cytochrome c-type biogenesis protein